MSKVVVYKYNDNSNLYGKECIGHGAFLRHNCRFRIKIHERETYESYLTYSVQLECGDIREFIPELVEFIPFIDHGASNEELD